MATDSWPCMYEQAADAAGVKLILGFQRRFDNNFQAVKRQIEASAIGGVRTFRIVSRDPAPPPAEYLKTSGTNKQMMGISVVATLMSSFHLSLFRPYQRTPGGIFLDMSSHDFDMARFLVGSDIEEVYAQGAAWGPEASTAKDLDTQVTLLRFTNGVFGTIENSRVCAFGYDQRVEVFGDKGALLGQNRAPSTVVRSDASGIVGGESSGCTGCERVRRRSRSNP